MSKTLYVSDLDGTLMQPGAYLSETTLDLLNRSIAEGKLFTVATARTPATVSDIIRNVDMTLPSIVMTGAAVWDSRSNHYSDLKYFNEKAVRKLVDAYHEMSFPIYLFTLENEIINIYHIGGKLNDIERQFMEERLHSPFKHFHIPADESDQLPEKFDKTILFYGMQPTEHAERTFRRTTLIDGARPQFYHDFYGPEIGIVEAFAPEATKANAVLRMKERTGADRVVVFGDNINDIPMMKVADVAVAVENALPEVKEIADIVIGPNTEDSVAKFIYEDQEG
ncbi:MAG: HAD family hydrolase [Muribaculaceae bacterium]|nr:HAD family hydrolase [Muribaculaceae bacterium]